MSRNVNIVVGRVLQAVDSSVEVTGDDKDAVKDTKQ